MSFSRKIKDFIISHDRPYVISRCAASLNDPEFARLLRGYYNASSDYEYAAILVKRWGGGGDSTPNGGDSNGGSPDGAAPGRPARNVGASDYCSVPDGARNSCAPGGATPDRPAQDGGSIDCVAPGRPARNGGAPGGVKTVYLIEEGDFDGVPDKERKGTGLCALLRLAVEKLAFADYLGLTPVVHWGRGTNYYQAEKDAETENVFEYYFLPVSGVPYSRNLPCNAVMKATTAHRCYLLPHGGNRFSYSADEGDISELARVYAKYIRPNAALSEYLRENVPAVIDGAPTLGVHFRGTDFNVGFRNHPVVVGVDQCVEAAKKEFSSGGYGKIFLATDDERALAGFRAAFGDKVVCYTDTLRSGDSSGIHCQFSDRPLHYYRLGLEVLRDVYTLGCCDSLICGRSQVSITARYVNRALGRRYGSLTLLDNGIYQ